MSDAGGVSTTAVNNSSGGDGSKNSSGRVDIRLIPRVRVIPRGSLWRVSSWYNGALMIVGSVVAMVASFMLALDSLKLAVSDAPLACDVNTKLSCSKVSSSWQSTLLTIDGTPTPNAFFGLAAFGVFLGFTFVLMLGWVPPRPVRWLFGLGLLGCDVFAVWLFMESVLNIKVLCPWCLTMDVGCFLLTVGALRWWSTISWKRLTNDDLDAYHGIARRYAAGVHGDNTHDAVELEKRAYAELETINMEHLPVYVYRDAGTILNTRLSRFHDAWLGFTVSFLSMGVTMLLFLLVAVPVLVHAFS